MPQPQPVSSDVQLLAVDSQDSQGANRVFVETLDANAHALLAQLGRRRWMRAFYLADGTGAALQLGHRVSEDLDFFTREALDTRVLIQQLKKLGTVELQDEAQGTVIGSLVGPV